MNPKYIYIETRLSVTSTMTVAVIVFDIRACNATWSLGGEPSSGHALPAAAVHVVRGFYMKLSGPLNTPKKMKE
jgi:hypothetical protein